MALAPCRPRPRSGGTDSRGPSRAPRRGAGHLDGSSTASQTTCGTRPARSAWRGRATRATASVGSSVLVAPRRRRRGGLATARAVRFPACASPRVPLFAACLAASLSSARSHSSRPPQQLAADYVPPPDDTIWARRDPAAAGFDPAKLEAAIEFARTHETQRPRDFSDQERIFGKPLGPLPASRGGTNGLILRGGDIVAEFGDTSPLIRPTAPPRAFCRRCSAWRSIAA